MMDMGDTTIINDIINNDTIINDTMNVTDVMDKPTSNYIFYATNLCRLIFYTPIIFGISIIGSVIYDYVMYKDEEDKSKKSE